MINFNETSKQNMKEMANKLYHSLLYQDYDIK